MSAHVAEDAALYVLGALDDRERAAFDAHVDRCAECAHALAAASDELARIETGFAAVEPPQKLDARISAVLDRGAAISLHPARRRPAWYGAALAIAAALVIAVLPSAYLWQQNQSMHGEMVAASAAMSRIMTSPHRTVAFASSSDARVMYGPDGSWYCIVVRGAREPVDVVWKHDGATTMLGRAMPHGEIAMLYLPESHRMDRLALMQSSHVIGEARLVF